MTSSFAFSVSNPRFLATVIVCLAISLVSGCGQKGPLVLPSEPTLNTQPVSDEQSEQDDESKSSSD